LLPPFSRFIQIDLCSLIIQNTALGIDMKGLVKSEEQLQAEQQQAMMMQLTQQGIGPAINAGGQLMKQGMENGTSQSGEQVPAE
jgi:hypothetical protein